MRIVLILCLSLLLSACATMPPETVAGKTCNFRVKELVVDDPRPRFRPEDAAAASPSIRRNPASPIPGPTLVLSGGSQHGAFGAGFLKRWAELSPGGALPKFHVVTGISTGAILSTWAFIGEPNTISDEYMIKHEKQLLNVYSQPSKSGTIGIGAALTLIRKNSLADLGPLRKRLQTVIDLPTLKKVYERPGRLMIAAVEVDTGNAVLFDMKDMAGRAVRNVERSDRYNLYRDCYVAAIMASSSVPLGARPVFIDNRMYIDGGARFGVFVQDFSRVRFDDADDDAPSVPAPAIDRSPTDPRPKAPALYILINGTQWASPDCGKADPALCKPDPVKPDPVHNIPGRHKKWDIASLAFRSNDILINQVYRFSAAHVQSQYKQAYPSADFIQRFHFARIHRGDIAGPEAFVFEGKSCSQWHDVDKEKLKPFEFYPSYMRCLQAYGANQAEELKWFETDSPSNFEAVTAF